MPIVWNKVDNGNGLDVIITGDVSTNEILSMMDEISEDNTLDNRLWELWDFTDVGNFNVLAEGIQSITNRDKKFIESKSGLFIKAGVHSQDITFGMGRMYEAYSFYHPNVHIRAFRSRAEAEDWINGILNKHNLMHFVPS